ncbi:GNAT family N-acetyltransferase [Mangrovibacillus cuniculi]|uniref:GNAT family N-acetyltransferase n=1 Tax=Mangrovibacillus cuniculi TaxID=2593652 RepID=A0A7S8HF42_9BACI|nr:GNAT family N-acetyltransferase [Mangrovibacillus cuniculi]QPC46519.1 GNAT family N-acetyltransferase [Mangrovibacillus cuniculi]
METMLSTKREFKEILAIDEKIIGTTSRAENILQAILENRCIHITLEKQIAGFILYDNSFFEYPFVSLVMVDPLYQGKGLAGKLLRSVLVMINAEKVFSSTNESNKKMQSVFQKEGFIISGVIDHLDDGDPEMIYVHLKQKNHS